MANIKISELPLATSPLNSAVEMPVVQGGVTKRAGMSAIGFLQSGTNAVLRTAQNKMRDIVNVDDFGAVGDGSTDDSAAFTAAFAASANVTATSGKVYVVKDLVLNGRKFDGNWCVLRDAVGARWGIKLQGFAPGVSNVFWQDQGNCVSTTTLASPMLASATVAVVTSASGIEVGDVIFIDLDASEVRHQTFVTNVAGTSITLRDAVPLAASAGKQVDASKAIVWVATAENWIVDKVQIINGRAGVLIVPENSSQISNFGVLTHLNMTSGARQFGVIKAGNSAGIKAQDLKIWCGYNETFNYVGTGGAGPFSFDARVFLLRDVTVTVNGVLQVYLTAWNYASQTSIQFLPGFFPAVGAAIVITHFRDGYRGFVEDQRNTAIISGGNIYDTVECLDAFVGVSCFETDLVEFTSLIADTCQYQSMQLTDCTNTCVFTGETFLGFSGRSLSVFNSQPKCFNSLYTFRALLAETWLPTQDDNIFVDGTSVLRIGAPGWTGEFATTTAVGGKIEYLAGELFIGRNTANISAGSTVWLGTAGDFASVSNASYRAPRNLTLKEVRVDVDTTPGVGQSYTYDVFVNGVSVGSSVISGGSTYAVLSELTSFVAEGDTIGLRLITSAGAAVGTRHFMQVTAI